MSASSRVLIVGFVPARRDARDSGSITLSAANIQRRTPHRSVQSCAGISRSKQDRHNTPGEAAPVFQEERLAWSEPKAVEI